MAFWNMKHGRLASEVPKGFFRAVFGVPRMRASVCSVVTLQYAFPLISLKNRFLDRIYMINRIMDMSAMATPMVGKYGSATASPLLRVFQPVSCRDSVFL